MAQRCGHAQIFPSSGRICPKASSISPEPPRAPLLEPRRQPCPRPMGPRPSGSKRCNPFEPNPTEGAGSARARRSEVPTAAREPDLLRRQVAYCWNRCLDVRPRLVTSSLSSPLLGTRGATLGSSQRGARTRGSRTRDERWSHDTEGIGRVQSQLRPRVNLGRGDQMLAEPALMLLPRRFGPRSNDISIRSYCGPFSP